MFYLINGYIGVGNILIGKIPSGYMTGIDLRSTACQTGAYTTNIAEFTCDLYIYIYNVHILQFHITDCI